jgi:hypothetical protein
MLLLLIKYERAIPKIGQLSSGVFTLAKSIEGIPFGKE